VAKGTHLEFVADNNCRRDLPGNSFPNFQQADGIAGNMGVIYHGQNPGLCPIPELLT
jgi:hypothetical protein